MPIEIYYSCSQIQKITSVSSYFFSHCMLKVILIVIQMNSHLSQPQGNRREDILSSELCNQCALVFSLFVFCFFFSKLYFLFSVIFTRIKYFFYKALNIWD